jgi:hypothetical protein
MQGFPRSPHQGNPHWNKTSHSTGWLSCFIVTGVRMYKLRRPLCKVRYSLKAKLLNSLWTSSSSLQLFLIEPLHYHLLFLSWACSAWPEQPCQPRATLESGVSAWHRRFAAGTVLIYSATLFRATARRNAFSAFGHRLLGGVFPH